MTEKDESSEVDVKEDSHMADTEEKQSEESGPAHTNNLFLYGAVIAVILIFIVLFVSLSASNPPENIVENVTSPINPQKVYVEITEQDIFPLGEKTGEDISVFGVVLGDTKKDVEKMIGLPDLEINYPYNSNWEYRDSLRLDSVGLLIHFDNDTVTRITMKTPFNKFLHNETVINYDKSDIYTKFGKPDELQLLSFFTQYTYYEKGFEVFQSRKVVNGFSLIPVQPEKARNTTVNPDIIIDE